MWRREGSRKRKGGSNNEYENGERVVRTMCTGSWHQVDVLGLRNYTMISYIESTMQSSQPKLLQQTFPCCVTLLLGWKIIHSSARKPTATESREGRKGGEPSHEQVVRSSVGDKGGVVEGAAELGQQLQ